MREAPASFARFKQRIHTGFTFQKRKTALLRNHWSESKSPVQFVDAMKTWRIVLWLRVDVATHFIVDAFNAGFLIVGKKSAPLVEWSIIRVDNFELRDLKNYNFFLVK